MSGPPPIPPQIGADFRSIQRQCPKCHHPVSEDGWCEPCSTKRRRALLFSVGGACLFFGFWSCSIGTGFYSYRNPEPWMIALQYIGTALFMGGPLVCVVVDLVANGRSRRRRHD